MTKTKAKADIKLKMVAKVRRKIVWKRRMRTMVKMTTKKTKRTKKRRSPSAEKWYDF